MKWAFHLVGKWCGQRLEVGTEAEISPGAAWAGGLTSTIEGGSSLLVKEV